MISEEEARTKILDAVGPLPARSVPLGEALNHFAAEELAAQMPMPLFDNSAMDGYAVVAPVTSNLRVIGEQPAGRERELRVSPGEAVRIFTGAPMPAGANAVVMQEDVARNGDEIAINDSVEPGEFVRHRGCDLASGQRILSAGERITPQIVALLAAQGFGEIKIGGDVFASVLSTGDELAEPGQNLAPGQIYDSNSALLEALLRNSGGAIHSIKHCRDDLNSVRKAIEQGAQANILVISGGVSVGEHDFVRQALESLGAKIDIWRVAIKPGKPFLFAKLGGDSGKAGCAVFGLPGNPVSAYVTFFRFVRPALLKMMGGRDLQPTKFPVKLGVDVRNDDGKRPHYLRGKLTDGVFMPVGRQESHALFGLSQSNAIMRVEAGEQLKAGTTVDIEIWE